MATVDEVMDKLMKECKRPEDLIGMNSLLRQLFRTTLYMDKPTGTAEHPGAHHSKE